MGKSRQLKILLSIGASNMGGAQRIFLNIIEILNSNDFDVTIVVPEGSLVKVIQSNHPDAHLFILPPSLLGKIIFISKLTRSQKFDLYCSHLGNASLWFALASSLTSSKLCCTFHNVIFSQKSPHLVRWAYKWLYKFILWRAYSVVAVSEYLKQDTEKKIGQSFEKIKVIPNGIPFYSHAKKSSINNLTIGIVGRCTWEKGHLVLIKALSQLKDLNLKCHIIGEGIELPKLKSVSQQLGVEDVVKFRGWSDNVQQTISESIDVLIVPSLEEAFSLATLEAFSVSVPVIGSRCGGIPALIDHNINGLLFEKGNENELARQIRKIATNPQKIPEMGAMGFKKFSKEYTLEKHKQRWLQYIKDLS
ncbi:MAG: glycosyltransferase family 4 protein [Bdellovibrionales bacterium]|nr:glycosyltransferase family 4 protein [Bdellovibrionales bacterium]